MSRRKSVKFVIDEIHTNMDILKEEITDRIIDKKMWHSDESDVFHIYKNCHHFKAIYNYNIIEGHGNKKLCSYCILMAYEEECIDYDEYE